MELSVKYKRDEVYKIVAAEVERQFGKAPAGKKWVASGSYGEVEVELIEDKDKQPAETPVATKAGADETPL
jgi:hypothetical protein